MGLALWGGSPGLSGIGAVTPGTTPIVGGTNTRVLFDDNGVIGESANLTFDKTNSILTLGADVNLVRQAANTLALRNVTSAQTFQLYRTYTDGSNYEHLTIGADDATAGLTGFSLLVRSAGTGAARALYLGTTGNAALAFITNNSTKWTLQATGHLTANTDNAYDIGASGATRPRNYYGGGTITTASTIQSTAGNVTGQGFVLNRGAANYGAILDNGDGIFRFYNGTSNNFTGIQLGGTSSQFPSIYTVNPSTASPGIRFQTADLSTGIYLQGLEQTAPAAAPRQWLSYLRPRQRRRQDPVDGNLCIWCGATTRN